MAATKTSCYRARQRFSGPSQTSLSLPFPFDLRPKSIHVPPTLFLALPWHPVASVVPVSLSPTPAGLGVPKTVTCPSSEGGPAAPHNLSWGCMQSNFLPSGPSPEQTRDPIFDQHVHTHTTARAHTHTHIGLIFKML